MHLTAGMRGMLRVHSARQEPVIGIGALGHVLLTMVFQRNGNSGAAGIARNGLNSSAPTLAWHL